MNDLVIQQIAFIYLFVSLRWVKIWNESEKMRFATISIYNIHISESVSLEKQVQIIYVNLWGACAAAHS